MAYEAVTPPVVGSVRMLRKGRLSPCIRASAAEILAICISESVPSIIRAPPEQDTTTSGSRSSTARSMQRVTFSPTTTPIDPPMKAYSIAPTIVLRPPIAPTAETTASKESVLALPARSRSA